MVSHNGSLQLAKIDEARLKIVKRAAQEFHDGMYSKFYVVL